MKFINLTGHPVTDINTNITFDPQGCVRVKATTERIYRSKGIPVYRTTVVAEDQLPDPVEGTVYIVSNLYLNTCTERTDVVAPGKVVRGADGEPIACRGFRCN